MTLPLVAERLSMRPLLLAEAQARATLAGLRAMEDDEGPAPAPPVAVIGTVAVLGVRGLLVPRQADWGGWGGVTGYDSLRENIALALNDPAIKAIALDVDSGGGFVDGCFDLVDALHAARGVKPIWAICADHAYSAAYALASAADRVTVPRTGGTGSVGVIAMLLDLSAALKDWGLAVHFIHHGARKAEESRASMQGVKPALLARLQTRIDAVGELFVATVARNRAMDPARIRALEADCLPGAEGVAAGLADAVQSPADAFAELLALAS